MDALLLHVRYHDNFPSVDIDAIGFDNNDRNGDLPCARYSLSRCIIGFEKSCFNSTNLTIFAVIGILITSFDLWPVANDEDDVRQSCRCATRIWPVACKANRLLEFLLPGDERDCQTGRVCTSAAPG